MTIDGVEYEAFNTSGGLGTLAITLKDKVKNVNYKRWATRVTAT